MNNTDTTYREKGRAVFLAAIMVLSVVAMTASLAAPAAAADVTVQDPGEPTDMTVAQETAQDIAGVTNINVSDPDTAANADLRVEVNVSSLENAGANLTAASIDGTVSVSGVSSIDSFNFDNANNLVELNVTTDTNNDFVEVTDLPLNNINLTGVSPATGIQYEVGADNDTTADAIASGSTPQAGFDLVGATAVSFDEQPSADDTAVDITVDHTDTPDEVSVFITNGSAAGTDTAVETSPTGTSTTLSPDPSFADAGDPLVVHTVAQSTDAPDSDLQASLTDLQAADSLTVGAPIDVSVDPGSVGVANDFTFTFDASGSDAGDDIDQIRVDFDSASGIDETAIDADNVSVAGTDTGSIEVDSVGPASNSVININLNETFTLSNEGGDIAIGVDNVDAPNAGDFLGDIQFLNVTNAQVAQGSGQYTISEEGLQVVDVDGPRVSAHGVDVEYDVTVTNTADSAREGEVFLNFTEDGGAGTQSEGPTTVGVDSGAEETVTFTVNTGDLPGNDSLATVDYDATANAADTDNGTSDTQTERLKVGSDSNGGINIRVQDDLQPDLGETTDVALFTLDDFTIGPDGQPDVSEAFAVTETDSDGEASFRNLAVGESDQNPIQYVAVAAATDPNFESTTTQLELFEATQTSTEDAVFIDRIVTADDIRVLDPDQDPADVDPVDSDIDVEVGVFTTDFEPVGDLGPFPDTPVEANVTGFEDPNGFLTRDDVLVNGSVSPVTDDTDSEGNVTYNFVLDLSGVNLDDVDEDIDVEVTFTALESDSGEDISVKQNLTFVAEPPSGDGTISGTVDEIREDIELGAQAGHTNISPSVGTNVHAVRTDRLLENTLLGEQTKFDDGITPTTTNTALSVIPDEQEFARTVVWNTTAAAAGEDAVVEVLDVQTDYLFWTPTAPGTDDVALTQNLSIEGTGFNVEDTDFNGGTYAVTVLEPDSELPDDHTYAVQVSNDGNFTSPNEADVPFDTPNNLTYAGIQERYADVPAEPTDVTNSVGDFELLNLYTNGENDGELPVAYTVIASDGNADLGYANARGYEEVVEVFQNADATEDQLDVDLSVQAVEIQADSVNVTNVGTHPPLSETGGAPDFDEVTPFDDQSDEFRQEVPRDGETIDVINLRTFVEEDDTTLGDEVTVSLTGEDVGSFDGEFAPISVGGQDVSVSADGQTITLDTSAVEGDVGDGEAFVFLFTDESDIGVDANVTIDVQMDNAAGEDSTAKRFFGLTEYDSGSIKGDIARDDDALTDTFVWTREIVDAGGNEITILPHVSDISSTPGSVSFADLQSDSDVEELNFTVAFNDSSTASVDESFVATGDELRNIDLGDRIGPVDAPNVDNFNLLRFANPLSADNPGQYSMDRVPAQSGGVDYALIEARQYDTGERGTTDARNGRSVTPGLTRNADITIPGAVVEATYELSNLDPATATVPAGADPINVSADVENTGLDAGEQDITLEVTNASTGDVVYSDTIADVVVDAGLTQTVEFTGVPAGVLDPGEYEHTVLSDDDSVSGSLTVEEGGVPPGYVDDGETTTPLLQDAIDDWRAGDIDTDTLRAVIDNWRSS